MPQTATAMDRSATHLLVVDDDDRIRELLKRYLTKQGYRASAAASAMEARDRMQGLEYDLLILDIMMPGEDGLSFAAELREHNNVPIIFLSALDTPADRISGLKVGADDYLTKPFEAEELLLRIDSIFRRTGHAQPVDMVRFGPYAYSTEKRILTKNGTNVKLTTSEQVLLSLLAKEAGATVSRYALSENIDAQSERAVDVQITRLRRKIEDSPSDPQYLLTVRGKGYRLVSDPVES